MEGDEKKSDLLWVGKSVEGKEVDTTRVDNSLRRCGCRGGDDEAVVEPAVEWRGAILRPRTLMGRSQETARWKEEGIGRKLPAGWGEGEPLLLPCKGGMAAGAQVGTCGHREAVGSWGMRS